ARECRGAADAARRHVLGQPPGWSAPVTRSGLTSASGTRYHDGRRRSQPMTTTPLTAHGRQMPFDPVWATVSELSRAYEARTLSPVDVVAALMQRTARR